MGVKFTAVDDRLLHAKVQPYLAACPPYGVKKPHNCPLTEPPQDSKYINKTSAKLAVKIQSEVLATYDCKTVAQFTLQTSGIGE